MDSCPSSFHHDLCAHFNRSAQSGGSIPYFVGGRQQTGAGIGSLFRGLAKTLIPLASNIGRRLVKSTARSVKKQAVKSLQNIGSDILQGRSIGESMKSRGKETLRAVTKDVFNANFNTSRRQSRKRRQPVKSKQSSKRQKRSPTFKEAY